MVLSKTSRNGRIAGALLIMVAVVLGILVSPWAFLVALLLPVEALLMRFFVPKDPDADERSL